MAEYGTWLLVAALIIVVLAVIAGRLLWQLRALRRRENTERRAYNSELDAQGLAAREGISILARSYLAGQLGGSECALRVAVLAESAVVSSGASEDFSVFSEMAAALAHIPSHSGWKALSPAQRAKYSAEMAVLEAAYHEKLQAAAQSLVLIP